MSTSLYWEPVKPRKANTNITDQLKYIIAPRYWSHDGSLMGEKVILDSGEISYLCGIKDGTRDADIKVSIELLIQAIENYGAIKIWLE